MSWDRAREIYLFEIESSKIEGWFLSGLSFSHSVALNDRSENPKSKATMMAAHSSKTPENLE